MFDSHRSRGKSVFRLSALIQTIWSHLPPSDASRWLETVDDERFPEQAWPVPLLFWTNQADHISGGGSEGWIYILYLSFKEAEKPWETFSQKRKNNSTSSGIKKTNLWVSGRGMIHWWSKEITCWQLWDHNGTLRFKSLTRWRLLFHHRSCVCVSLGVRDQIRWRCLTPQCSLHQCCFKYCRAKSSRTVYCWVQLTLTTAAFTDLYEMSPHLLASRAAFISLQGFVLMMGFWNLTTGKLSSPLKDSQWVYGLDSVEKVITHDKSDKTLWFKNLLVQ